MKTRKRYSREPALLFREVSDLITGGTLLMSVLGADAASYLTAYGEAYLQEEIRAEALTRNIGNFARFLEVVARQNGQVTNVSSIARDSSVSRQTVQNYFTILEDTLLGYWIEPWRLKRCTKQFNRGLHRIQSEFAGHDVRCYGVYMGEKKELWDDVEVMPVKDFLSLLWNGEVL